MDIEVSYNFELLLFEAENRDASQVRCLMDGLKQSGACGLAERARADISRLFASGSAGEAETRETISRIHRDCDYLLDPHGAVGVAVAERFIGAAPMVTLATAHPAKFPDAVEAASGVRPPLPAWAGDLMRREETYEVLPADLARIEHAIEARSRAVALAR